MEKHSENYPYQCLVLPFTNSILLKGMGCGELALNTMVLTKEVKLIRLIFTPISQHCYLFPTLIFDFYFILFKFGKYFSFIFLKVNFGVSRPIIYESNKIHTPLKVGVLKGPHTSLCISSKIS
jgi:hypothetical protein